MFLDKTYYGCIKLIGKKNGVEEYTEKAWCSTKVDVNTKKHIGGKRYYGDCPSDCPSAEEAAANQQSANQYNSGEFYLIFFSVFVHKKSLNSIAKRLH